MRYPYPMRRSSRLLLSALLLAVSAAAASPARGEVGLSASFAELSIGELEPGASYDAGELGSRSYRVKNRGTAPVTVRITVELPRKGETAKKEDAIPDPGWLRVLPDIQRLEPGEEAVGELRLTLPPDKKLRGRRFLARLVARTEGPGPVSAGVVSHVRFSVKKKWKPAAAALGAPLSVEPPSLHLDDVCPGRQDPERAALRSFTVSNAAGKLPLRLRTSAVPWDGRLRLRPLGFALPERLDWAGAEPGSLEVPARGRAQVRPRLVLPGRLAGRRVAFLMSFETGDGAAAVRPVYLSILDSCPR